MNTKALLLKSIFICVFLTMFLNSAKAQSPAGIGTSAENVLWLRSDQGTSTTTNNNPVSGWTDASGNSNDAAQSNAVNQPLYISSGINGLPTLRFDGVNDFLTVPDNDNLDNTAGVSVFVVAQPDNQDATPRGIVSKRVSAGNQEAYYLFTHTNRYLYFNASTSRINGTDAVTDQSQLFSAVYNGNIPNPRSRVFINGSQSGSGNGPASIGNMASDLHIGILNPAYGSGFRGDISEVIVYRTALNAAERSIVEAYLGNRYSLSLGNTAFSSTTHNYGFIGIGHSQGEKYIQTQSIGSGLYLEEINNSLDETNEFVFAGHDNTAHGTNELDLPTIPDVNLDQRWNRVYYIERIQGDVVDAGETDVRIGFDCNEAGIPADASRLYVLLYRAGTSGEFSHVSQGYASVADNKVYFNVANANFSSGYYTIARSDLEVLVFYSFNDGNWDDLSRWSLNPSIYIAPPNLPGPADRVVIQENKTITVNINNIEASVLEVNHGIIDFQNTTGHVFSTITGLPSGLIRISSDNFPLGNISGFADASSGGTVEYYGAGFSLEATRTFRNLVINLNNAASQVVLLSNYTINGNLTISRGELHFGNGSSTISRNLTVYENVTINANGKIRTGTANARHQFSVYGDFTNYGNLQFTNRVAVNFGAEATNGIVDVNFRSAVRDQNMILEGPARFYRIAIEKGLTNTYELYMEAAQASYFELFGYAGQGHPDNAQLSVNNNAFGLAYGTVRVGPNITIARLNQGGNYNVSENAILWVDGGSVTKPSGTGEAVVVYGKIKISNGTFTSNAPSGITSRLNGIFESTGGTTVITQFRTSVYGSHHIGGYIQTGGHVTIDGHNANNNYYSFSLSYEGNAFILTGGTMTVLGTNTKGAMFINSDPVNHNVSVFTGALLNLVANSTRIFKITSRAPFPNVIMSRDGAGAREFVLECGSVGTTPANMSELNAQPLVAKGSLTIQDNIIFNPKGNDVTIGAGYSIGSGASYIAASNNTIFSGAISNFSIAIHASATTKYFHNLVYNNPSRIGTLTVSDIVIGNNLSVLAGTFSTGNQVVTVRGNITNSATIENGASGKILITHRGRVHTVNLTNGGSYTSVPTVSFVGGGGVEASAVAVFDGTPNAGNPLPISKIVITNTGRGYTSVPTVSITGGGGATATAVILTTHEIGGNGNGVFGNLEIDEPTTTAQAGNMYTFLTSNQTVDNQLIITSGVFDLRNNKLRLNGGLSSEIWTDYGNTRMIRTTGNHSDGGFERYIAANQLFLFPVGTRALPSYTGNLNRYTPLRATISNLNPSDNGFLQVNPVGYELPTLNPGNSNERALAYYWRLRQKGFSSIPNVNNVFTYDLRDVRTPPNINSYVVGKIVELIRYGGTGGNSIGSVAADNTNAYNRNFIFNQHILETGEFTGGHSTRFSGTVKVFFSRLRGTSAAQRLWTETASWTTLAQVATRFGLTPQQVIDQPNLWHLSDNPVSSAGTPVAGDIAVIGWVPWNDPVVEYRGDPHNIRSNSGTISCSELIFNPMKTASGDPAPRQYWDTYFFRPTLTLTGGTTLVTPIVSGEGTIRNRDQDTDFSLIDLGDFVAQDSSYVLYEVFSAVTTLNNIPEVLPNLLIAPDGWGGFDKTAVIPKDILVKKNLEIHGAARLRLNNGVGGNIHVLGDLRLQRAYRYDLGIYYTNTRLEFQNNGIARTLTIEGDFYTEGTSGIYVLNPGTTPLEHTLNLYGSYIQNATNSVLGVAQPILRLWTASNQDRVNLLLLGESSMTFSGSNVTTPMSFYNMYVNKGASNITTALSDIHFTLNGLTDGATSEKALQLQNGTLILNHPDIDINLSTGGGDFQIPSTSGLVVRNGIVNVNGANTGILLDGLLEIETGGTVDLDGGIGVNNYIEYSSSGAASIEITGGELIVGSQIRRGTSNPSGVLRYTQSGGNVIVGKNSAPQTNRGVFEVLNTGSRFVYTGGSITIVRPQTGASPEATVLIEPNVGFAGNATLQLGNDDTPASSVLTIKSTIELGNLVVTGVNNPTARLKDRSLILNRDLSIDSGCAFDGTGSFNLTVKRHIYNNGSPNLNVDSLFLYGTNTYPSSAMQEIHGSVNVKNLIVSPQTSVTLQPATNLSISENLYIRSGQLVDGGNNINVSRNVYNDAAHVSSNPSAGGIIFSGTLTQRLFGLGQFGRVEVNNSNNVIAENNITLQNNLTLRNGIFQIQYHKLTLGLNANVINEGGPFSETKIVAVDGSSFLRGIEKYIPAVAGGGPAAPYDINDAAYTYKVTIPIGSDNGSIRKYTPVEIAVGNSNSVGSITIFPVSNRHITIDPAPGRVLQYYWNVESRDLSSFTGLLRMHYLQGDVRDNATDEASYLAARLYNDEWSKFSEPEPGPGFFQIVDEINNHVGFTFTNVPNIIGEYTAGIGPDIPGNVPVFISTGNGNWINPATWIRDGGGVVPDNGPAGHIVRILTGHTVIIADNFRQAYRTEIHGTGRLNVGSTVNHILGIVSGTGTLELTTNSVPAGNYDAFIASDGGTFEFGGVGYGLPTRFSQYNNLILKGSGTKSFPAEVVTILGNLSILETTTLSASRNINLRGNLTKDDTANLVSSNIIKFEGNTTQQINGNFSGAFWIHLANSTGSNINLNGNMTTSGLIWLENGVMRVGNGFVLQSDNTNGFFSSSDANFDRSWIEGTFRRRLSSGTSPNYRNQAFAIGRNGKVRHVRLSNVSVANQYWTAEYFDSNPLDDGMDPESINGDPIPLEKVSNIEFWRVVGPDGASARVQLNWGYESGLPDGDLDLIRNSTVVGEWNGSAWTNKGNNGSVSASGNGTWTSGTVNAGTISSFSTKYFTIATTDENNPLPVEFLSIDAYLQNEYVVVEWVTATERNNDFFTVERSRDAVNFEVISVVQSKAEFGNSNQVLSYSVIDSSPLIGLTYYRIKQTDFDGTVDYSNLIGVFYQTKSDVTINLYPNPNRGYEFNMVMDGLISFENVVITITNLYGKTVQTDFVNADDQGRLIRKVSPVRKLEPGVYIITVSANSGRFNTRMVVN